MYLVLALNSQPSNFSFPWAGIAGAYTTPSERESVLRTPLCSEVEKLLCLLQPGFSGCDMLSLSRQGNGIYADVGVP